MAPLKGLSLFLVTIALSMGAAMDALDISVANVCIPDIAGDLDISPFDGAWVISGYALTNAAMILLTGFLATRIGEVRLFVLSVLLFTLASFACGLAPNFSTLIAFRLLQGIAAGPLVPLCQSLLMHSFPARLRTVGLSICLMLLIIAPIFGPVVGGYIADTIGWRWIFFLNIPLGIFVAALSWFVLKERETPRSKVPIDFVGICLLVIGVGSFQLFLSTGNDHGWFQSPLIITLAVIAFVCLSYFVVWSISEKHPVIDFSLFKLRNYSIANLLTFFAYIAFYAGFVLYPIWLQIEMGYTALWAGYALIPLGAAILFLTPISGLIVEKDLVDLRLVLTLSFIAFALSFYWAGHFNNSASFRSLLGPRILLGVALGLFAIPSYVVALSNIAKWKLANAVSVFNFGRVIGVGIGTAIGLSGWQSLQNIRYHQMLPSIGPKNIQLQPLLNKLQFLPEQSRYAIIHEQLMSQSNTIAINGFFIYAAAGFLICMALIWFLKPPFPHLEGEML
ncbi:MAG: Fatty acid resistance protein FarB [Chlamydiales bacterium]|nr:Fatty acid resistance protein FarB [Chlamydiales bacterium]MCH9635957.1 Fatty acid resistance protein FarB [Chlamydiales bacterium]MCH9703241.1 DHA2 family efflux MFS transporter permease subunit [Chlamydiota bacterium]